MTQMPENDLKKAMDLLDRAAAQLADARAPDATWWKEYFLLTGEHMVLTDEGWEPGEVVPSYLEEDATWMPLDEVNAPDSSEAA
jgi:hypothetical protein